MRNAVCALFLWPLLVGFVKIPNLHAVNTNIYRGGRPAASDLVALKSKQKVAVDLDLENNTRVIYGESISAEKAAIEFKSFPMSPWTKPDNDEITHILALLKSADQAGIKIFVHCQHGQDRTGLIIGLYRVLVEHERPQEAYKEMLGYGFHPFFIELDSYFKEKTGWTAPDSL